MEENQGSLKAPPDVLLSDTFTLVPSEGSLLPLQLTQTELLVQVHPCGRSGPSSSRFLLADCVGCRCFKGKNQSDPGGYFTVVFYPLAGGKGSTIYRQRVSKTFRAGASQDRDQNMDTARTWTQKIKQLAKPQAYEFYMLRGDILDALPVREKCHPRSMNNPYAAGQASVLPSSPRLLVLLNPHGGTGEALHLFQKHVTPMLMEADINFTLLVTERPNQARELVRDEDLSRWDIIVVMAGDGLMFEVVNGLMARPDWMDAIKKPLAILPGGSGNALAASINHYIGHQQVMGTKLLVNCAYVLCKGQPYPLDLVSVTTSSEKRLFSFLSLAWGFISDVDIESEKYRFMGSARFSVGTFVRLTALRTYRGRLSYVKASASTEAISDSNRPTPDNSHPELQPNIAGKGLDDSLLSPLDQPVPSHWTVVPEDQFVFVLAVYLSHLGADMYTAPMVKSLGEGCIHLFYGTSRMSRGSLLKLFLSMEKGTHLDAEIPHLTHVPVTGFRIEPLHNTGIMTVDGECIPCGPIQGQVHRGLASVLSIPSIT